MSELERPTHYHGKMMITVFSDGTLEYFLNSLPRSRTMDTSCFARETIGGLEIVCCLEGKNPHQRKATHHFDTAPMHKTRAVMGQLEQS
jgi:hypothetical protein